MLDWFRSYKRTNTSTEVIDEESGQTDKVADSQKSSWLRAIKILSITALSVSSFSKLYNLIYFYIDDGVMADIDDYDRLLTSTSNVSSTVPSVAANSCETFFDRIRGNYGGYFELPGDLDCHGVNLKPIGDQYYPFKGTLDGKGYTIKGLTMLWPERSDVGLFSHIQSGATFRNLNFERFNVIGSHHVGVIFGATSLRNNNKHKPWIDAHNLSFSDGRVAAMRWQAATLGGRVNIIDITTGEAGIIQNVTVTNSTVNTGLHIDGIGFDAAGLVSQIARVNMRDIFIKDTVIHAGVSNSRVNSAAGIAGFAGFATYITDSVVDNVLLIGQSCGGFFDAAVPAKGFSVAIDHSQIKAHFIADSLGGAVRLISANTSISQFLSEITVSIPHECSGVGGIVGEITLTRDSTIIQESYANISTTALPRVCRRFGGLVGIAEGGYLIDCYATGSIEANGNTFESNGIGGLVGEYRGGFKADRCYSTVNMSDAPLARTTGAVAGYGLDRLAGIFWNPSDSGLDQSPGGGERVSRAQMQHKEFYERHGWSFFESRKNRRNAAGQSPEPKWQMSEDGYPTLPRAGFGS